MHALSSELGDMESALAQLRTVMDGAHSGPPAAAPAAAAAVSGQLAAPAGAGSRRRIEPLPVSLFASLAAVAAGGSGEGARGSVADAGTAGQQAVDSSTTPARFTLAAAEHTPATTSSWATATPGTALHTGLPMPQTAGPAPAAVDTAAMTTALGESKTLTYRTDVRNSAEIACEPCLWGALSRPQAPTCLCSSTVIPQLQRSPRQPQ